MPATVTQKSGAENVDQSPDHNSRTPGYWLRNRKCSCSVIALSHTTPLSTTPGRFELSCGTHRSARLTATNWLSSAAIWRSWATGSRGTGDWEVVDPPGRVDDSAVVSAAVELNGLE